MFIIQNGKFFPAEEPVLKITNRAFCYGDALFETMRWQTNRILFLQDHVDRLFNGMKFLKMEIPKALSAGLIQKQILELIKKNKIAGSARIRLEVYRNEGGYYTPTDNSTGFVINAEKLNEENYILNKKALTVGVFSEIKKLKNPLSNFKTSNSIIYTLAGIFAKENKLDDCFVLNTDGNIADSISSNVFIVKNEILKTPPIYDGCVDGVMRKNILRICRKNKIKAEEKSIQLNDLAEADEIFLTNVIRGIKWVRKYKVKNYGNDFSKIIQDKISEPARL